MRKTRKLVVAPKLILGLLSCIGLLLGCSIGAIAADEWGYIDNKGKTVLPPIYRDSRPFDSGYAFVRTERVKQLPLLEFIDKRGEQIINLGERNNDWMEGGLIKFEEKKKFGFRNPSGKIILPAKYSLASSFSRGRAVVEDPDAHQYLVIDQEGKEVYRLPLDWKFIENDWQRSNQPAFKSPDGLLHEFKSSMEGSSFALEGDLPGFENKFEADSQFDYVGFFSDGLAVAERRGGLWCYIDRKKEVVIPLPKTCHYAGEFHEGLACVVFATEKKDNVQQVIIPKTNYFALEKEPAPLYFQFIDKTGRAVTDKFPYPKDRQRMATWTSSFSEGLALATAIQNHRVVYGYINHAGTFVIAPQFIDAREFSDGLASVNFVCPDFSSEDWRKNRGSSNYDHVERFKQFLWNFKPIGMPREELVSILGEPDLINKYGPDKYETYGLSPGATCGNAAVIGNIKYTDGKVSAYRFSCMGGGPWVRTNTPPADIKPSCYQD
jgi:hypothetical protein